MLVAALRHMLRRVLAGLRALHPRPRRRRQAGAEAAAPASKTRVTVRVRRLGSGKAATTTRSGGDGSGPGEGRQAVTIRVATFNAALFSMAPAVQAPGTPVAGPERDAARRSGSGTGARPRPKGILKAQASLLSRTPSKARVSINLQDNEISLDRSGRLNGAFVGGTSSPRAKRPPHPPHVIVGGLDAARRRSVEEVLRETGADIIGLQNVRAEEERGMRPLSDLAAALGMRYVFAESWAPEYGNAVLSRWPIKRWKALRVADHSDVRWTIWMLTM